MAWSLPITLSTTLALGCGRSRRSPKHPGHEPQRQRDDVKGRESILGTDQPATYAPMILPKNGSQRVHSDTDLAGYRSLQALQEVQEGNDASGKVLRRLQAAIADAQGRDASGSICLIDMPDVLSKCLMSSPTPAPG